MSEGTRQALRQLPLSYTSDTQHLYRLPGFTAIDAPGLVWSAGSAWRRGLSKVVCDLRERHWQNAPLIRLGLHPVDMRHRFSRDYWLETLKRLIDDGRRPVTKSAWLDSLAAPASTSPAWIDLRNPLASSYPARVLREVAGATPATRRAHQKIPCRPAGSTLVGRSGLNSLHPRLQGR